MSEDTSNVVRGNPHVRIIIVDDESDKIPRVLGISEEREIELDELIKVIHNDSETITDSMANISKVLKHANELAYCIFHLGAHVGRAHTLKESIHTHLGSILGKSNGENAQD